MTREEKPGKYGEHPRLSEVVQYIDDQKAVSFSDLQDQFDDMNRSTLEIIMVQADALDKVDVSGAGQGRTRYFTSADSKQFTFTDPDHNEVRTQVWDAIKDLDLDDDEAVEVRIAKVPK